MKDSKVNRRQFLKGLSIGGAAALVASYPLVIERFTVLVNTYSIHVPDLPKAFEGYTVVHLSDLHYGKLMPLSIIESVIQKANSITCDMIACSGDYVTALHDTEEIDTVWPHLIKLQARDGVYTTLGNHDHWADTQRSLYWLEKSGQNIRHKSIAIQRGDQRLWIGGAGDLDEDVLGIDQAFQGAPDSDCKILLAHNPDTADAPFDTRVSLMLCGHTHGGQIVFPFIGPLVLPVRNRRYASGFVISEKTRLFISRGIGTASVPLRINCYPEIAVLQLTSQS
jgi:predicted MPP superfamily phosphohydrolase